MAINTESETWINLSSQLDRDYTDVEIFNEGGTAGEATNRVGLPHCDIHRQVRGMSGTKNKDDIAGSFYGTT